MARERLVVAGLFGIPVAVAVLMMAGSAGRPVWAETTQATGFGPIPGLVQPSDTVDLACSEKGIIEEVTVDEGMMVKKGQVVCKLESGVETASVKISQAQAESEIDIQVARYAYELAEIELKRLTEIDRRQAAAPKEIDTARINERYREALVRKAQHDQRIAKAQYARDQKVVERRTLLSPLDGYVSKKNKSPGELLDGINDAVVCQIVRLDPLHVIVPVPANTYGQIKLGDGATLTAEQLPQGRAKAKVVLVDRVVQSDSQTYTVKLELPNPESRIPTGMKVGVTFP